MLRSRHHLISAILALCWFWFQTAQGTNYLLAEVDCTRVGRLLEDAKPIADVKGLIETPASSPPNKQEASIPHQHTGHLRGSHVRPKPIPYEQQQLQLRQQGPGRLLRRRARMLARLASAVKSRSARILYHHLHKSAGTTMCHKVLQAGHRVLACDGSRAVVADPPGSISAPADCNCNGYQNGSSPFTTLSRKEQLAYMRNHSDATMFFSESPLGDDLYFGPALLHLTVVRHPFSRFLSHILQLLQSSDVADEEQYNAGLLDVNHVVKLHATNSSRYHHHVRDNFMTRFFGGLRVDDKPFMAVTLEHFAIAAANLKRLGAVFVLEDLARAEGVLSALMLIDQTTHMYRAGTNYSQVVAKPGSATTSNNSSSSSGSSSSSSSSSSTVSSITSTSGSLHSGLSAESLAYLHKLHGYDLQLYELAKQRHNHTVAAWEALTTLMQQSGGA